MTGRSGHYLRKRVDGDYDPSNGWQAKWTYKVCWVASWKTVRLVAMTDGMVTRERTPDDLEQWIEQYDMVQMTQSEMMDFMREMGGFFPEVDSL